MVPTYCNRYPPLRIAGVTPEVWKCIRTFITRGSHEGQEESSCYVPVFRPNPLGLHPP